MQALQRLLEHVAGQLKELSASSRLLVGTLIVIAVNGQLERYPQYTTIFALEPQGGEL